MIDTIQTISKFLLTIEEYEKKEEKYRWHDLRKNPNDLPEKAGSVLVKFKQNHFREYSVVYYMSDWVLVDGEGECIEKWKYIEPFEEGES